MIKSKFWSIGFWSMLLLTVWFIFLFIATISQVYFDKTIFNISVRTPAEAHVQLTLFSFAILLFGSIFLYGSNIIYIDTINKIISFKNIITQKTKSYSFDNIDGYVDTVQKDGNRKGYKIIYVVKDKKFVGKISTFFCSNFNQLKDGLSELPYLGFQNLNIIDSFKVLFGMDVLK